VTAHVAIAPGRHELDGKPGVRNSRTLRVGGKRGQHLRAQLCEACRLDMVATVRGREPIPRSMTAFATFIAVVVVASFVGNGSGARAGLVALVIALLIGVGARAIYLRTRR
jgi:L-cystine uptake protein TcyP (sodium:dicarboxylate symporter family)